MFFPLVFSPGESHQYLGVQGLLRRTGAAARSRGGGQGDGPDGPVGSLTRISMTG